MINKDIVRDLQDAMLFLQESVDGDGCSNEEVKVNKNAMEKVLAFSKQLNLNDSKNNSKAIEAIFHIVGSIRDRDGTDYRVVSLKEKTLEGSTRYALHRVANGQWETVCSQPLE